MKSIFTFLFVSLLSFGQNRLSVQIRSCKKIKSSIEQFNEVELYRNDSLVKTYEINFEGSKQFENITEGDYYVIVNTFFGKKKSEIIKVKNEVNSNVFVICIDELNENILNSSNSIIDNLKNDEEIKLNYSFGGCFNSGKFETTIIKKKGKLFLKYNSKIKKLSKKQISILKIFFIEFENLKDCNTTCVSTSNSKIEVLYQKEKKSFSFSCYKWSGFQNLEKDLKIKIKKESLNKKL